MDSKKTRPLTKCRQPARNAYKRLQNAFKLLKDENSVIIWHDCGNTVNDYRYEVIAGIIKGCPPESLKHIYRVQNTLCGIYTKKSIKPSEIVNKNSPIVLFDMEIKSRPVL